MVLDAHHDDQVNNDIARQIASLIRNYEPRINIHTFMLPVLEHYNFDNVAEVAIGKVTVERLLPDGKNTDYGTASSHAVFLKTKMGSYHCIATNFTYDIVSIKTFALKLANIINVPFN